MQTGEYCRLPKTPKSELNFPFIGGLEIGAESIYDSRKKHKSHATGMALLTLRSPEECRQALL